MVYAISAGFHERFQTTESAVIQERFVDFRSIVIGLVSDVTTRQRVSGGGEAVGHKRAIFVEVRADPTQVPGNLRLAQPARKTHKERHVVRRSLGKPCTDMRI